MATARRITATTQIYQLNIRLRDVRPPVWRRVQVPGELTLAELHKVIQTVMGWTNSHLHEFDIDGVRYGVPDPDWDEPETLDESKVKLSQLVREDSGFRYTYDFGDDWHHDVTVENVHVPEPGTRYPCCVAGRRACPPEDVGGPWGYEEFLAALADPTHDEHAHWMEWAGGGFDAGDFDVAAADKWLEQHRWAPAASQGSGGGRLV